MTTALAAETKVCRDCGEVYAPTTATAKKGSVCAPCRVIRTQKWRAANPEKQKALVKKQHERDKALGRPRKRALARKYGITPEQFDEMLEAQDGRCPGCRCTPDETHRGVFDVDHNHETGEVRGLLCPECNKTLGLVKDNVATLLALADYLGRQQ